MKYMEGGNKALGVVTVNWISMLRCQTWIQASYQNIISSEDLQQFC